MSCPAIRIEDLGKRYVVDHQRQSRGGYRTLRESLVEMAQYPLKRLSGEGGMAHEEFWALKDVSFEVQPGEVVGIIGRNGAGKSTLLKILSQITKPTTGRVELNGRVGSLLEVGTGFHPELTGRENIYLNGSILGMKKKEIDWKFDEIVSFSGVERFLDTPVKRYSSGMYVRLAFAVAAHLEPEILVVDEVLAVGDAEFQAKCLGKMKEVGRSGRTVIFVSHNLHAVAELTDYSILLGGGRKQCIDISRNVIAKYLDVGLELGYEWTRSTRSQDPSPIAEIRSIRSTDVSGAAAAQFAADEEFKIHIECHFHKSVNAQLAFRLNSDHDFETVFTSALPDGTGRRDMRFEAGTFAASCTIPPHLLIPGKYHVLVAINNFGGPCFDIVERALRFEINNIGSLTRYDGRVGKVSPLLKWEIESQDSSHC